MKRFFVVLLLVVVVAVVYLLLAPTKVQPVAWSPKPAPSATEGTFALNDKLKGVQRIAQIGVIGPEGIAVDAVGRIYAGYLDGRVARFAPDGSGYTFFGNTHGRPLGTAFGPDGGVVVADADKGLMFLSGGGEPEVLVDAADGVKFGFTDDLAVEKLGKGIYFSDASSKFGFGHHMEDLIEHGANGRLIRYDFRTKETKVLMNGLHFANGVAIGPEDAFVLVNETSEYRVMRYWLKGDKAGTSDVFIDNLPCFPDNLSYSATSRRFWIACAAPRDPMLDKMAGDVFARTIVAKLPAFLQPKPKRHSIAIGVDLNGQVVANLQYAGSDAYSPVTSVREFGPWLYFGSLTEKAIARMPLRTAFADAPPPPPGWEKVPGPYEPGPADAKLEGGERD
jgi:sugar lactone lactonase YvrE